MKLFLVCSAWWLLACTSLLAQPAFLSYTQKVSAIHVQGLVSIQQDQVYAKLSTKINQPLSATRITNDIKALYQLGFFRDIQANIEVLKTDSIALTFVFKEKARIQNIRIKGNTLVSEKSLLKSVKTKERNMPNLNTIRKDVAALRALYVKDGLFKVKILYEIKEISPDLVDLTFTVFEVPRSFLTQIKIHGAKFFYPLDLERQLQSSEIDCFGWMTSAGVFDQNKINQDLQILTQLYLKDGFLKVFVKKPRIRIIHNPVYSRVIVDLYIEENDRYFVGDLSVQPRDEFPLLVEEQKILDSLSLQTKDPFNVFLVNQDVAKINNLYQGLGYAFSEIQDLWDIDDEKKVVNIDFFTIRNEKAYIGRIDFTGNTITEDYVLRRELEIFDGELYNSNKLSLSQLRLRRLGYFEVGNGIQFSRQSKTEQQVLDYQIRLKERSTSSINGGLAYSNNDVFSLTVNFSSLNFLGKGLRLSVKANLSTDGNQNYSTTFYEPYFLDSRWSSTTSLSQSKRNVTDYDLDSFGVSQQFGYAFWQNWSVFGSFGIENLRFSKITARGLYKLNSQTSSSLRTLQTGVAYNTINDPQFPSSGSKFSVSAAQTGKFLGGKEEFQSFDSSWQTFISLNASSTLVLMTRWQYSQLLKSNPEKNIPVYRRLYLGGLTSVRGYEGSELKGAATTIEVKPDFNAARLSEADKHYYYQHLGGVVSNLFNFELLFPLTREGRNIRGVVFMDVGNTWSEDRAYEITGAKKDFKYYRYGYGAGVRLITPFGVIRLEYAEKGQPKPGETKSIFEFYVSSLF